MNERRHTIRSQEELPIFCHYFDVVVYTHKTAVSVMSLAETRNISSPGRGRILGFCLFRFRLRTNMFQYGYSVVVPFTPTSSVPHQLPLLSPGAHALTLLLVKSRNDASHGGGINVKRHHHKNFEGRNRNNQGEGWVATN